MKRRNKIIIRWIIGVLSLFAGIIIGGSFYMLNYSLASDPDRMNTDSCYIRLFENYPETEEWVDSLRQANALRDTFMTFPEGYSCHAYFVKKGNESHGCGRTALLIHGWRDQAIKFFYLARMYEREFGYNVVMPDVYGHGQSDGDVVRMGWLDRLDMLRWLEAFKTDTMVVHGVSMGGAMAMMVAGEPIPAGIKDIRFVNDCGYTSVWDEFAGEMKARFGLPEFPLMYTSSLLCKLRYGWSFGEASALEQVRKSPHPMLFIHGDRDTFVPTEMVYQLYEAKPTPKDLWITKDTEHAMSYKNHREEYIRRVREFLK